jgi:hypothetical protein
MFRVLLALSLPSVAGAAAPLQLSHQGRLLTASGTPVNGPTQVAVGLYDTELAASPFWERTYANVPVEDGYYAVSLVLDDGGQPLDLDDFDDGEVWVGVTLGTTPVPGRQRLASVPYALVAGAGGGGVVTTTVASCTTNGQLAWNTVSESLVVCYGGSYHVLQGFGEHVVINDMIFPDTASVAGQGWTCNHATPWSTTTEAHMHLHNNGAPTCSKDVSDLRASTEYRFSFRRYSTGERLTIYALDSSGTVTGTLHQKYHATGDGLLADAYFTAPSSGRIRILFDDPDNNDGGISHVDLRSVAQPEQPHVALTDRTFANVTDVFQAGWDANHTGAFSTTGENHIHLHNFAGAYIRRNFRVLAGASYTLTFKRWSTGGRVRVHAIDRANNATTTVLASGTYGSSNGELTTLTFTAPTSGVVQVELDSPSVTDFGFNHITLTSP